MNRMIILRLVLPLHIAHTHSPLFCSSTKRLITLHITGPNWTILLRFVVFRDMEWLYIRVLELWQGMTGCHIDTESDSEQDPLIEPTSSDEVRTFSQQYVGRYVSFRFITGTYFTAVSSVGRDEVTSTLGSHVAASPAYLCPFIPVRLSPICHYKSQSVGISPSFSNTQTGTRTGQQYITFAFAPI